MNGEKFNIISKSPRVLVAPLDWGLGHATRCIPIINELLVLGCEVLIAANGATKDLLQIEFPSLMFLSLRGYTIKYSRNSFWLPAKLLIQLPKLFLGIFRENRWLQGIVQKHQVTMVISDNRPGMYHKTVPCIYITHQLHIITGHPFTEWMTNKIHTHFINRYTECWVPDAEDKNGLAGPLRLFAELGELGGDRLAFGSIAERALRIGEDLHETRLLVARRKVLAKEPEHRRMGGLGATNLLEIRLGELGLRRVRRVELR